MSDHVDDLDEAKKFASTDVRILLAMMSVNQRNTSMQVTTLREEQIRWQAQHDDRHQTIAKDVDAAFAKIAAEGVLREKLAGKVRLMWFIPPVVTGAAAFLAFLVWLIDILSKKGSL